MMKVPNVHNSSFSKAPRLWNDLPDSLRLIDLLELLKSNLKTHLFKAAFVFNIVLPFLLLTLLLSY